MYPSFQQTPPGTTTDMHFQAGGQRLNYLDN